MSRATFRAMSRALARAAPMKALVEALERRLALERNARKQAQADLAEAHARLDRVVAEADADPALALLAEHGESAARIGWVEAADGPASAVVATPEAWLA